jgi:cytochrome c-type biogenesis protein CcmF
MMGNVSEPSTKHFWNRDIFTHITYAEVDPTTGVENKKEEYSEPEVIKVGAKDTVALNSSIMYVKGINKEIDPVIYRLDSNDIGINLIIECINSKGKRFTLEPVMIIKGTQVFPIQVEDEELGLKLAIKRIIPEENSFELVVSEKKRSNFIIMQAIVFPYINVLWLGCIIMVIGSLLSVYYRIRTSNK